MPQLDPTPWFPTLTLSWLVFLTILPLKIMAHVSPNGFNPAEMKKFQAKTWAWPWH
uniref:ATP synthase complex subunit 8 n=1 Tax=Heniochus chrysostomus TaxID=109925 RepID=A0A7U0FQS6_HENCH|nr:ATP synthase F0 subunit 8 [Heniochus chrysostomus]QQV70745.1 ATP synthase F0 subunit 8 [Heniochus chrysostomus]